MNIAIIGCGLIGKKRAENIPKGHKLVAICDTDKNNANKILRKNKKVKYFKNWKDIFRISKLDCIIVSTPHNLLFKITNYGLKQNKSHLFVEKPGVKNFKEIKKLINTYKSIKDLRVVIRFGFNHRFLNSIIFAKKLIFNKEIGNLLYMRGVYGHGGKKNYKKEWRGSKKISGGGQLVDQGIHLIDLARLFFGDLKVYSFYLDNIYWNTNVEDNVFLTLKNKKKIANLHASWTEWKNKFHLEFFGKEGKIEINGKGGSYGPEILTLYKMLNNKIKPKKIVYKFKNKDLSWSRELNSFFLEIKEKKSSISHLNNLYKNFQIIDNIYNK